ncbi:MAG: hypothetical protein V4672_12865 [Verrucomicrobiota bacterium]
MKSRLEDLMQRASVAQPPDQLARSNWIPYLPIIRILMEERAHSLTAAVDWLVAQGEIPTKSQGMAYRALRQILARREAKQLRQLARAQRQLGGRSGRLARRETDSQQEPSARNAAAA